MKNDSTNIWEKRYLDLLARCEALENRYEALENLYEALENRYEALETKYDVLKVENEALVKKCERLTLENELLREKLNTNSKNSSKPPSQDFLRKKKPLQPSGCKPGAQTGHKGHQRAQLPPEKVKKVVDLLPDLCPNCAGTDMDPIPVSVEQRQVVDFPEIQPDVTQYNIHTSRCLKCGKNIRAEVPLEAIRGFGPRLMGLVTLLSGESLMSKRKISSIIAHFGIKISLGSVVDIHQLAKDLLKVPFAEIKSNVLSEKTIHADETGWFLRAARCWIWTGSTAKASFFQIDPRRSQEAFRRIFGLSKQILISDRYSAYNTHKGKRQFCLAHISRDFTKISERNLPDGALGRILKEQLAEVFSWWRKFKEKKIGRRALREGAQIYVDNIWKTLQVGAGAAEIGSKTRSLCANLIDKFKNLWIFLEEEGIEPTNNAAERAMRPFVVARKLSNGSQSEWGLQFSERIMSLIFTLKQCARNAFTYLTELFTSRLSKKEAPSVFA